MLVEQQRRIGYGEASLVAEGRDMGSVVFPDADLKFYMQASIGERARRRFRDMQERNIGISLEKIEAEIAARDKRDSTRAHSPLVRAEDAEIIDTTGLSIEEQVTDILRRIEEFEAETTS